MRVDRQAQAALSFWLQRLAKPCFVYVLREKDDTAIKVGVAKDPIGRIAALQCGNRRQLQLLHVLPGGYELESHLHRHLKRNRTSGEWFDGKMVEPFLERCAKLSDRMRDAYVPASGEAPHHHEVDPVRFRSVRKPREEAPITVRFVEPDPVVDPEEAQRMRDSVSGCTRSVYLGPANPLVRRRISPSAGFYN